jgi:hypothetical protein
MNLKGPVTNFTEATNNKVVESLELKKLAEELGLDFAENKDNLKKFMVYNNRFQLDFIFTNVSLYPRLDFHWPRLLLAI